jgi:hypothetical protein
VPSQGTLLAPVSEIDPAAAAAALAVTGPAGQLMVPTAEEVTNVSVRETCCVPVTASQPE